MVGDPADAIIADYYAFGARNFDTAAAKNAMVARGHHRQQRPTRTQLPGQPRLPAQQRLVRLLQLLRRRCPRCWSTTPPTSPSPRSPARSATPPPRASSPTGRRTGRTCSTPARGFMQPRNLDGSWRSGFNAASGTDFVEGTSWQYTGMVPFNVRALADRQGRQRRIPELPQQRAGRLPRQPAAPTPTSATSRRWSCPGSTTTSGSRGRPSNWSGRCRTSCGPTRRPTGASATTTWAR